MLLQCLWRIPFNWPDTVQVVHRTSHGWRGCRWRNDIKRIRVSLELEAVVGQRGHSKRSRGDLIDVWIVTRWLLVDKNTSIMVDYI